MEALKLLKAEAERKRKALSDHGLKVILLCMHARLNFDVLHLEFPHFSKHSTTLPTFPEFHPIKEKCFIGSFHSNNQIEQPVKYSIIWPFAQHSIYPSLL